MTRKRPRSVDVARCQTSMTLRTLRIECGLTQQEVAERINYSRAQYANFELQNDEEEKTLIRWLLKGRGRQRSKSKGEESPEEFGSFLTSKYAELEDTQETATVLERLADAFGLSWQTLFDRLGLLEHVPLEEDFLEELSLDLRNNPLTAVTAPKLTLYSGKEPHAVFSRETLPTKMSQDNESAYRSALAALSLGEGLIHDAGFFICSWTDEFLDGRDRLAKGEVMWVDTASKDREEDALYLVTGRTKYPLIRRAVKDHRNRWWLASDHHNQRLYPALQWKNERIIGRLEKLSSVMCRVMEQEEKLNGKNRKARQR
ncbi:helix-turn-helix domain-containing protein [Deinococcus wulumuqiensis]